VGGNTVEVSKNVALMNPESKNPPTAGSKASDLTADALTAEQDLFHQELVEQKDLYLRLAADFENFKRRSRQETETRAAAQKESFIHELLPVIDNLERALTPDGTADSQKFRQGVEMTLHQLRQLLSRHGVEPQAGVGQRFDPHLHEAVSQRHDPAHADHTIVEVLQRGYQRGTKNFRPAKVIINDLTPAKHAHNGR
jgi:molecular chaperone GrpE